MLKKQKNNHRPIASDRLPSDILDEPRVFIDDSLEQLYAAIRQLSEVDRGVILLYLEEKSYQEIADIMGTNPNNIGVRIQRIKVRLKKILDGKIN